MTATVTAPIGLATTAVVIPATPAAARAVASWITRKSAAARDQAVVGTQATTVPSRSS